LILTTIVVLCCTAFPPDASRSVAAPAALSANSADVPKGEDATKPDAPTPKLSATVSEDLDPGMSSSLPAAKAIANVPVKPATTESYETPRKRMIWYGLMVAAHGTAAFDAWTTRRAITGGYGTEGDPLQRPFANSNAIYATTQVAPLLMDYVGHRMMRSRYPVFRRLWWVPQAASASVSLGAGIHNYRVVP
jgi:hypothetical protein